MICTIWMVYVYNEPLNMQDPKWPWSGTTIIVAKGGDILVHLAGCTAFLIVGMRRVTPLLVLLLAVDLGVITVTNRGGMVSFGLAMMVLLLMRPPKIQIGALIFGFLLIGVIFTAIGPNIEINDGTRTISPEQFVTNIKSVLGQSDSDALEGTKKWRIMWWEKIWDYTVKGPLFWTGRGFGINLAKADGFLVIKELRSPHNGHMTYLARGGVPLFALWIGTNILWLLTVLKSWWTARRRGDRAWVGIFAVLVPYWVAFNMNASFDVYLEGPMGGIWSWTVFGIGLAACYVYKHRPDVAYDTQQQVSSLNTQPPSGTHADQAESSARPQPLSTGRGGGPGVRRRGPALAEPRPFRSRVHTPQ